jgi:tRNA threonylcarbamoyladenosine biosynthesis protein TsaB
VARDGVVIIEEAIDPSRQLAVQLPRVLRELLERCGVGLADIDAFAVATGPGSFTGMRIGIATMQGLAFGQEKSLIGVSGLTALQEVAATAASGSRIATWVDAWRGDVYAAVYEDGRQVDEPIVAKPSLLVENMRAQVSDNDTLFIGDGADTYRDLIVSELGPSARLADPTVPLLAGAVARLATIDYTNGHRPPPHAIRPLYVRRSDAELARARIPTPDSPISR